MSEYSRAYSKGYAAGSRGIWPDHRPPKPPDALMANVIEAARKLRDGVDAELACLDPDDEWTRRLGPLVDSVDEALAAIGDWVRSGDAERVGGG